LGILEGEKAEKKRRVFLMKTIEYKQGYFFPLSLPYGLTRKCEQFPNLVILVDAYTDTTNLGFFFNDEATQKEIGAFVDLLQSTTENTIDGFKYADSTSAAKTSVGCGSNKPNTYTLRKKWDFRGGNTLEITAPYYHWDVRESSYPSNAELIKFFATIMQWSGDNKEFEAPCVVGERSE
jgi:hypothetical protein